MRSFADYRKSELRRDIYRLNVREGFNRHFDILRYDLLEAAKLPSMMFENVAHNVAYEKARKDDYTFTRAYFEDLVSHCKTTFYDELMEAAAVAPADSLDALKRELVDHIKAMCEELRRNIAGMLTSNPAAATDPEGAADAADSVEAPGAAHLPDDDDPTPSTGTGPGAAGRSGPTSRPTARPASGPARPASGPGAVPSAAPVAGEEDHDEITPDDGTGGAPASGPASGAAGGGPRYKTFGKTPWDMPTTPFHSQKDLAAPDADGTQPAPYGSFLPSKSKGGFWGGLGRLAKAYIQRPLSWLTRPIRQVWHGDEDRYMRKESVNPIGQMLLEHDRAILDLITKFETDLLAYVDQQIAKIAKLVGANPALATSSPAAQPKPVAPGAPVDGGAGATDKLPVTPRGAGGPADVAGNAGAGDVTGGDAARKGAAVATGQVQAPPEQEPSPAEEEAVQMKDSAAAVKGGEMLGIKISGIGAKGGLGKVDQSNIDFGDGKPESSWAKIRERIYAAIYAKFKDTPEGQAMIEAYLDQKRKTPHPDDASKMMRGTIARADRVKLVCQYLNVTPKGTRSAAIQLLAAYFRKTKGIPTVGAGAKDLQTDAGAGAGAAANSNVGDTTGAGAVSTNAGGANANLATNNGAGDAGAAGGDKLPVVTRDQEEAVPGDAPGLLKYIQAKHPELYAALNAEIPDPNEVLGWVEKGLSKNGGNGKAMIAKMQQTLGLPAAGAGDAGGDASKKVTGASGNAVAGPADQAAVTNGAAPPEKAPGDAGGTAGAPDQGVKVAGFRTKLGLLAKEPGNAEHAAELEAASKLSDEELGQALGDLDPNSDDAVLSAIGKVLERGTGEPAGAQEPAQAPGQAPAEAPPEKAPDPVQNGGANAAVNPPVEGDPVAAAKAKAGEIAQPTGREALNNDPRMGALGRAVMEKALKKTGDKAAAIKHKNAILDQADAIADKDGVDAAIAFLQQQSQPDPDPVAPADQQPPPPDQPPAGGELQRGEPVDPKAVQQEAQVDRMIKDFEEKLLMQNSSMDTDAVQAQVDSLYDQYEAVKEKDGPEKALAWLQDQIAQQTASHEVPDAAGVAAPVKPAGKPKAPVVQPRNTGPVPDLGGKPGKAKKPSAKALKAEAGMKAARELQFNDKWLDMVDRLQDAINRDPESPEVTDGMAEKFASELVGRVARGSLPPEEALKILQQRVGEAAAKVGMDMPSEKVGSKKKKKKKGTGVGKKAHGLSDKDDEPDIDAEAGIEDGVYKDNFQHILNQFRKLLAG